MVHSYNRHDCGLNFLSPENLKLAQRSVASFKAAWVWGRCCKPPKVGLGAKKLQLNGNNISEDFSILDFKNIFSLESGKFL